MIVEDSYRVSYFLLKQILNDDAVRIIIKERDECSSKTERVGEQKQLGLFKNKPNI